MLTLEQKREVEEFLYREAFLLDEMRFDEWLDMLTEDIEYTMPLREHTQGEVEPAGHPIIKDDKLMLTMRAKKHETGLSHVEIPRSLTEHIVTNILIEDGDNPTELRVYSNFLVRQARKLRDEAWWAGRRKDVLRREDGAWKIARREVLLDSIVLPRGITIFF